MKSLLSNAAIICVLGLMVAATPAHACDCLLSKNWSNPACKGKTPKLPGGGHVTAPVTSTNTNTLGQGQTQTQGQGQTQTASATGGNSNVKVSTGSTTSSSVSGATGGAGGAGGSASVGKVSAAVGNVAGGSATGGSSSVGPISVGPSTSTANASNQGNSHATGGSATTGASQSESDSGGNSYSSYSAAARIPVSTALAGVGVTTAGCRFAEGLGVQTMPAGTSLGFSFKDHDCARFQLAQFLYSRGQDIAGDKVMCQISELKEALGSDCLAEIHEIVATTAVYPDGERERRQARAQWESVQK